MNETYLMFNRGMFKRPALLIGLLTGLSMAGHAASALFSPRELFRIPFGEQREALGTRIESGSFQYPRDFTLDGAGRFYIYDIKKHRIARYSPNGAYQIGFAYPATAGQVFAHADSQENLWLIVSDPARGLYYGVYDAAGKRLRDGLFSQYDTFRLHVDDDSVMQVILSSSRKPAVRTYIFHEPSLLLKRIDVAPPPENHRRLKKNDRTYFIDKLPGASQGAPPVQRITDESRRPIADIKGDVIYITAQGEIYTRVGDCQIHVYEAGGAFKGKVALTGLPSACRAIRFDPEGNIYQLDGIPNAAQQYTPEMTGMRLVRWERR
jgi:hypothetical protein